MRDSDTIAAPKAPPIDWSAVADGPLERGDHVELAALLARTLLTRYEDITSSGGKLYGYSAGVYRPINDELLERNVTTFAGLPVGEGDKPRALNIRTSDITGTIRCLHIALNAPGFFDKPAAGVAFRDGFAVVDGGRLELVAHAPEHRAQFAYDFDFVGSSEPAMFLGFLREVFRDDADRDDKMAALQEFFGAAITGCATVYERAALLLGNGSDGKSRLAHIIEHSMPTRSVIALEPAAFADVYQRPLLAGARLNSVPDISEATLSASIKGIISGEGLTARDPGGRAKSFKPCAAHLFGCNRLPSTNDKSDGFFRRWLILKMTRSFLHDPIRDVSIHFRIIDQDRPAIVRWALEGAARLQAKNDYTLPVSHALTIAEWRGREDAVRVFIDTRCTSGGGWTPATELYEAFKAWGAPYGKGKDTTATAFGLALKAMGIADKRSSSAKLYGVTLAADLHATRMSVAA